MEKIELEGVLEMRGRPVVVWEVVGVERREERVVEKRLEEEEGIEREEDLVIMVFIGGGCRIVELESIENSIALRR